MGIGRLTKALALPVMMGAMPARGKPEKTQYPVTQ